MLLYKEKIKKTVRGKKVEIKSPFGAGYALTLQALSFNSTNPNKFCYLLDADGDQFVFKIPGQAEPGPTAPEVPVSVKLPLYYFDETGGNELILWGEVEKIERKESGL